MSTWTRWLILVVVALVMAAGSLGCRCRSEKKPGQETTARAKARAKKKAAQLANRPRKSKLPPGDESDIPGYRRTVVIQPGARLNLAKRPIPERPPGATDEDATRGKEKEQ